MAFPRETDFARWNRHARRMARIEAAIVGTLVGLMLSLIAIPAAVAWAAGNLDVATAPQGSSR